jgi:hypothetical protein
LYLVKRHPRRDLKTQTGLNIGTETFNIDSLQVHLVVSREDGGPL